MAEWSVEAWFAEHAVRNNLCVFTKNVTDDIHDQNVLDNI